jgi:hypothetical protein
VFINIQYTDGQEKSLEKEYELKKLERQERLLEEKAALYKETRQVLSFLSNQDASTSPLYKAKRDRFWELYWGDLAAVESAEIESLMVRFGNALTGLENEADDTTRMAIKEDMKQISLSLARQTKTELSEK